MVAVLLSFYVLFAPDPGGPEVGWPYADKAVHLLLFALLAVTARLRLGAGAAVLAALAGYAVLSEVVQARLLADRSGDARDVVADLLGVALAWAGTSAAQAHGTRAGGGPGRASADLQP